MPDAESYFDIDEFNDLYAKTKPTLYIKMSDIFSIHQLVASEINYICPNPDDILKEIVRDLGNVKSNESELMNVSSTEINLTLNPRLAQTEGKEVSFFGLLVTTNVPRSGSGCEGVIYGNQAMHPLYNQGSDGISPDGCNGQATHRGRRREMADAGAR